MALNYDIIIYIEENKMIKNKLNSLTKPLLMGPGQSCVSDSVYKALSRPTIGHYFTTHDELQKGADEIFEKVKYGKIKIRIFKEYKLSEAKQAHEDLESRKILGPSILVPDE